MDDDGYSLIMLDNIIDYKKDSAVALSIDDGYVVTRRGVKRRRKTTAGWKILIRWKDDTETWILLKDWNESRRIETKEFARVRRVDF